jgi:glycosyltransferase involved in cell wall biosynthesis
MADCVWPAWQTELEGKMEHGPLISIVLPTYNGSRYLCEAVESCLRQTYPHWELILVDDASTDSTPDIIAEYAARDPRIRALRNPVNRKLPGSLNVGFAAARGEYFTWTSDDNCYRPQALAEMVAFLQANSDVDLVYTDYTIIDEDGSFVRNGYTGSPDELPLTDVVGACFLYHHTVHEELAGYDEAMFLVEDYDFWLRASCSFRLQWLRKDLYIYRNHGGSLTATKQRQVRSMHEKCLMRNLPQMRWMNESLRTRAYRHLIWLAVARNDRRAMRSYTWLWMKNDLCSMLKDRQALAYSLLPIALHPLIHWHEPWDWMYQFLRTVDDLEKLVPVGEMIILVDEAKLAWWDGSELIIDRTVVPFLEHDGEYWGAPPDDSTAIRELERLHREGANYLAFAWPAFWWLDHYQDLRSHLRSTFRCALENDRVVVFDLRHRLGAQTSTARIGCRSVT